MAATWHNPDDHIRLELGETLRPAVEQVRRVSPPAESLDRALDLARSINVPRHRPPRFRPTRFLVGGIVAAMLLIGLCLQFGSYPFGGYLARNRPDAPDGEYPSKQPPGEPSPPGSGEIQALASPGIYLRGNGPFFGFGESDDNYLRIGISKISSHWADWERVQALRALTHGMPLVDRKAVEAYLRHLPRSRPWAWHRDARPLPHARIQTADGRSLLLLGVYVQVVIDGPRARTLIDHIFRNPHNDKLEASFELPLPDEASPSFFALFPGNKANVTPLIHRPKRQLPTPSARGLPNPDELVRQMDTGCWGPPRVAHVIEAMPGADVPLAMAQMHPGGTRDNPPPESSAGNIFRGSIGTILPDSLIRVVVAYEELLPLRNGKLTYHYNPPATRVHDLSFTLQADARLAEGAVVLPEASRTIENGLVCYRRTWRNAQPAAPLAFRFTPVNATVQAASGRDGKAHYLYARLRPDLPRLAGKPFARHAVFLLDTSASERPEHFARCVKLMQTVLELDSDIEHFNVLTFSTAADWLQPGGWLPNTKHGRAQALARLDGVVLEGTTDLSAALEKLCPLGLTLPKDMPLYAFLLSDGQITGGPTHVPSLVARWQVGQTRPMRWHCYQMGLGEENAELFEALTRTGGGVFRCLADRDVLAAALAHRRPCLQVARLGFEGGSVARDVLVAGRRAAVYPGGELVVAARFDRPGQSQIVLEGTLAGKPFTQKFPVTIEEGDSGTLAARGWGELAVASLLGVNNPRLDRLAGELAQQFGIASRVTAFAVVEGAASPGEVIWTGKTDLARLVEDSWSSLREGPDAQARGSGRARLEQHLPAWVVVPSLRRQLQPLIDAVPESDLTLPPARLTGGLTLRPDAAAEYLAFREKDGKAAGPWLEEADRRFRAGNVEAAVRVLSSLVEVTPDNPETIRLVGYRLIAMGRAPLAARLLHGLVEQQPFDPASHRALAQALEAAGRPGLAALHHEVTQIQLGGRSGWLAAVQEERDGSLRRLERDPRQSEGVRRWARSRLGEAPRLCDELLVRVTWNTTAAAVELHVRPPASKAPQILQAPNQAGYRHGPIHYRLAKASKGEYGIDLHLASLAEETIPEVFATVEIIQHAGTAREQVQRHNVLLRRQGQRLPVARVRFQ